MSKKTRDGYIGSSNGKTYDLIYVKEKKSKSPTFAPEAISIEDMKILSYYDLVLEEGTPILIPSNHWDELFSSIRLPHDYQTTLDKETRPKEKRLSPEFISQRHSFLFYEPPELFHFSYPRKIITHAFGGDKRSSADFKKQAKNLRDIDKLEKEVLSLLPDFYIPFAEEQFRDYLIFNDLEDVVQSLFDRQDMEKSIRVDRVWADDRIDSSYPSHIATLFLESDKAKNSSLIPPVPMIRRSSKKADINRVFSFNNATSFVRNKFGKKASRPYFHLYLDWKTMVPKSTGISASKLLPLIESTLKESDFSGICLTVNGYKSAASYGKFGYIETFVNELSSLADYYVIPLILPRSKWYGLKLLDVDTKIFSSLFNGKDRYTKRPKRFGKTEGQENINYGMTYLINFATELNYEETLKHLSVYKKFPKVENLPNLPDKDYFKNPWDYRIHVSKPRRLSHLEEAKYIRKGIERNVIKPASSYLKKSKNPDFGEST